MIINENDAGVNILHLISGCDSKYRDEILRFILAEFKSKINLQTPSGPLNDYFTAAHFAAEGGYSTTLSILLDHGADPNILDQRSLSVYDVASASEHFNCILVLERHLNSLNLAKLAIQNGNSSPKSCCSRLDSNKKLNPEQCLISPGKSLTPTNSPKGNSISKLKKQIPFSPFTNDKYTEDINSIVHEDTAYDFRIKLLKCSPSEPFKPSPSGDNEFSEIDSSIKDLSDVELRNMLKRAGLDPGPIVASSRRVYERQLQRFLQGKRRISSVENPLPLPAYSKNINDLASENFDLEKAVSLDIEFKKQFENEKKAKFEYFNYLLIDPRIVFSHDSVKSLSPDFKTFIKAIFYVGKGKTQRPLEHLYEAQNINKRSSSKACRISEIWKSDRGVISHRVFDGKSEKEAIARESLMIDALYRRNLCNLIAGKNLTGFPKTERDKDLIGCYFIYQAFKLFLINDPHEIRLDNF